MKKAKTKLPFQNHLDTRKLNAGVRHLKAQGLIKRDYEIADALDYSRPTVSEYITGKKQVSYSFLTRLEKHYKLDLTNLIRKANEVPRPEPTLKDLALILTRIERVMSRMNISLGTGGKSVTKRKPIVNSTVNNKVKKVTKTKSSKK